MNYFPPSPIPEWPWEPPSGCVTVEELVWEFENVDPGGPLTPEGWAIRELWGNGAAICISCGALAGDDDHIPCGH